MKKNSLCRQTLRKLQAKLAFGTASKLLSSLFMVAAMLVSCGSGSSNDITPEPSPTPTPTPTPSEETTFAKGADVGWLTEMEASNRKFYTAAGEEKECMALLKQLGMNAIRLRVWVNPTDGWCNKADVLKKAKRAQALGMDIMIDFHYGDSWCDPGQQPIPAAWEGHTLSQLKTDVADHTKDVLQTLKDNNISVKWVQVGNETTSGMLWPTGKAEGTNFYNFSQLFKAGRDAVKEVYADAQVIIHLDRGEDLAHFTWMLNGLKNYSVQWDIIGVSFYPEESNWEELTTTCLANLKTLKNTYKCPVMVCEVGMPWDATHAYDMLNKLITGCKADDLCLGVFYWEPECYNWKSYSKGAFNLQGRPTKAMNAFAN